MGREVKTKIAERTHHTLTLGCVMQNIWPSTACTNAESSHTKRALSPESGCFRRSLARYYGAPSSIAPGVSDGWTSGTPGRRMSGFETTEVMAGQVFNLTVLGADLPSRRTAGRLRWYERSVGLYALCDTANKCIERLPPKRFWTD